MSDAFVVLMYHELEQPGRPTCDPGAAYRRYVVGEAEFREQLACIARLGLRGLGLRAALEGRTVPRGVIGITFDDGCATDHSVAAGLLQAAGFGATFFLVAGFIGRAGYLAPAQVRQLSDAGFEIGSHSMQHEFLTALTPPALLENLRRSKAELEQLSGRTVDSLSCPGGRWSPRVSRAAYEAGYTIVATSRVAANPPAPRRDRVARLPIRHGMSAERFSQWCRGQGLVGERARASVLGMARKVLGNSLYHRLHGRLAG